MNGINLSRIANQLFRTARQPRRPVIHQRQLEVLPVRNGRKVHAHSTTVIPVPAMPITWSAAYARARAYVRVLAGLPTWPTPKQAEELAKAAKLERELRKRGRVRRIHFHSVAHQKRGGERWWNWKIADVIDERKTETLPSYRERGQRRRRPQPKENTFAGDNSKFRAKYAR